MSIYPETAAEALDRWDRGENVFTVEMGGIGPGYEQCIQALAFETIRRLKDAEISWEDWSYARSLLRGARDAALDEHDQALGGLTGAQAGAALSLAGRALRVGWANMLGEVERDRLIQVNREWPAVEAG